MENASKALIIAGAILLAILIISLGIMIYNQAAGVANGDAINQVDISSFNAQFTQYEGDHVRGGQVNALIEQVRTNNITYQDDTSRQVKVQCSDAGIAALTAIGAKDSVKKVPTGQTYSVKCSMSDAGLVNEITIGAAGSGGTP